MADNNGDDQQDAEHHAVGLDLTMITARHGSSEFSNITHIRLDRLGLTSLPTEVVASLPSITNWYLQYNRLTSLGGLQSASHTRFISAAHNNLKTIAAVASLPRLVFLDASCNQISNIAVENLPKSIAFLRLLDNPLAAPHEVHHKLLQHLPRLQEAHLGSREVGNGNEAAVERSCSSPGTEASKDAQNKAEQHMSGTIIDSLEGMEREVWKRQSSQELSKHSKNHGLVASCSEEKQRELGIVAIEPAASRSNPRAGVQAENVYALAYSSSLDQAPSARRRSLTSLTERPVPPSCASPAQSALPTNSCTFSTRTSSGQIVSQLPPQAVMLQRADCRAGVPPPSAALQLTTGAASAYAMLSRPPVPARQLHSAHFSSMADTTPSANGALFTSSTLAILQRFGSADRGNTKCTNTAMSAVQVQGLIASDLEQLHDSVEQTLAQVGTGHTLGMAACSLVSSSMEDAVEAMRVSAQQRARAHHEQQTALTSSIDKLRLATRVWGKQPGS